MSLELSPRTLVECEIVIKRGLSTFVEVGSALLEIRDARLYRESHGTFEDYCRERWNFSRKRAYDLTAAAEVTAELSPMGDTPPLPASERVARELAPLREEPTQLREAWSEAVERNGDQPTAAQVREVVDGKRAGAHAKATACPRCGDAVKSIRQHECPQGARQLSIAKEALRRALKDFSGHPRASHLDLGQRVVDLRECGALVDQMYSLLGGEPDQRTIEGVAFDLCDCGARIADVKGRPYCFGCDTYRDGGAP